MDAIEAMKTRRSVRAFKPDPIPEAVIEEIVDCGRMAASAINIQPWTFVVVTNADMRRRIAYTTDYGAFIAMAPVCVAVLCRDTKYYLEDGCAATQNMLVATRAMGLAACWVAGDKKEYAPVICGMLGAPPGYRLVSLVAIGVPAETPEAVKRPLSEVLRWERF
jgi:nitroreductase